MIKRLLFVYIICIACLKGYAQTSSFDPVTPDDPGANSWNATTGEAIIDRFTAGNLSATLTAMAGSLDKVKSLIVAGTTNSSDLAIMKACVNLETADWSRTMGYTDVPASAAYGNTALKKVIIPSCIETISDMAFYNCSSLVDFHCNATTPPALGTEVFTGVNSCFEVYVPASSESLYRKNDSWSSLMPKIYRLTYMIDRTVYKTTNAERGQKITNPSVVSKTGYTFSGWDKEITSMPAHNDTIRGSYVANHYTVVFLSDDGNKISSSSLAYGTTLVAPDVPAKEGYTFIGWNPELPATVGAGDATYTAVFNANPVTINYHKLTLYNEDGSLFATYESVASGSPLKYVITQLPTKVGYDFVAWIGAPETMPDNDLSLTASFSRTIYEVDGVKYQPDLSSDSKTLTGTVTVLGLQKNDTSSPAKAQVMMLSAKAGQETEANSIIIPSTVSSPSGESFKVTTIAKNAFHGSEITSITIPETVTKIEESAVSDCAKLQSVVFLGDKAPEMESNAVVVNDKVEVYVPSTANESFSEAVKNESGAPVAVAKADVVTNYNIMAYKDGETAPYETSCYSFGDNVVLTAPEKEYYDVVWTDKTSGLVSYTNPYVFSAVKDVEVEWSYKLTRIPVSTCMSITQESGCATFCAPYDVTIPSGVKAYTATSYDGSWIKMDEITSGTISANTPVVLTYTGGDFQQIFSDVRTTAETTATSGLLVGNIGNSQTEVPAGSYILQRNNNVTGWYKVNNTGLYVDVNRCYLNGSQVSNTNDFYGILFDEATGISNIATERYPELVEGAKSKSDGKYLVNGKLVIVKAGKAYNVNGSQY